MLFYVSLTMFLTANQIALLSSISSQFHQMIHMAVIWQSFARSRLPRNLSASLSV